MNCSAWAHLVIFSHARARPLTKVWTSYVCLWASITIYAHFQLSQRNPSSFSLRTGLHSNIYGEWNKKLLLAYFNEAESYVTVSLGASKVYWMYNIKVRLQIRPLFFRMNCFERLSIKIILNSEVLRVKHEGDKQVNFWRDLRGFR